MSFHAALSAWDRLVCRLVGHRAMRPWAISDHRPWCGRCGRTLDISIHA